MKTILLRAVLHGLFYIGFGLFATLVFGGWWLGF
jgi:hypothetical protein